jgi:hypothetical protein
MRRGNGVDRRLRRSWLRRDEKESQSLKSVHRMHQATPDRLLSRQVQHGEKMAFSSQSSATLCFSVGSSRVASPEGVGPNPPYTAHCVTPSTTPALPRPRTRRPAHGRERMHALHVRLQCCPVFVCCTSFSRSTPAPAPAHLSRHPATSLSPAHCQSPFKLAVRSLSHQL